MCVCLHVHVQDKISDGTHTKGDVILSTPNVVELVTKLHTVIQEVYRRMLPVHIKDRWERGGEERGLTRVTAHETRLFYVSHFSMHQLSDLSFPILLAVWWRTLPVSKFRCTSGSPPMQVPCLIAGGRAGSWSSWCSPTPLHHRVICLSVEPSVIFMHQCPYLTQRLWGTGPDEFVPDDCNTIIFFI